MMSVATVRFEGVDKETVNRLVEIWSENGVETEKLDIEHGGDA